MIMIVLNNSVLSFLSKEMIMSMILSQPLKSMATSGYTDEDAPLYLLPSN